MSKFNLKIETIIDGIQSQANAEDMDVVYEPLYEEDSPLHDKAVLIRNETLETYGVVCIDLEGKEPDEVQFMIFNPKLYKYSKDEGFDKEESYKAFGDKILKNVEMKTFMYTLLG